MPDQECDEDDCNEVVHTTQNGLTVNVCNQHFLEKMSSLRPNGEFEPVKQ